ncbi:MAG TPA: hypothetical protein VI121_02295 [Agromyces sp.]|jgi:hypothetical protein
MQHSADFTSFLGYQADVVRAERAIEIRRSIAERRSPGAGDEPTQPARRRGRATRVPRFTLRRA